MFNARDTVDFVSPKAAAISLMVTRISSRLCDINVVFAVKTFSPKPTLRPETGFGKSYFYFWVGKPVLSRPLGRRLGTEYAALHTVLGERHAVPQERGM